MEIKAKCKLDYDACKALTHLNMFRKANPKKRFIFWTIYLTILVLAIVFLMLYFHDFELVGLVILTLFLYIIQCYMYFVFPKISYKNLARMKEAVNEYIFCDDVLKTFTKSPEYNSEAVVEYSLFVKVYETSKYLFLYQTNNHVFCIDKNTIEGGTVEEIRYKLTAYVKNKYIICKY